MHIKEFATYCGVSTRTLHYYDEIGLLKPSHVDAATGYRFYDEAALLRMQEILFYRELDFPLKSIKDILSAPNYNKELALREQKQLLILKKERLENLITAIEGAIKGEHIMSAFDNHKFEQYKAEAKERWGKTDAYQEYTEKTKNRSDETQNALSDGMNDLIGQFADCMNQGFAPDSAEAQALVKQWQAHITEHYYTCTKQILAGLGQMYVADERFTENIDKHGKGTAAFFSKAIAVYCAN